MTDAIDLRLEVEPATLALAERDQLRLTLRATNRSSEEVDPELHRAELLVDGERSSAFSLAVGNGKRPPEWYALPAGASVSMTWSSLGPSLLHGSGEHTLVLTLDGRAAEPVTVRLLA